MPQHAHIQQTGPETHLLPILGPNPRMSSLLVRLRYPLPLPAADIGETTPPLTNTMP